MKKVNKFIFKILFVFLISFSVNAENKTLSIGSEKANIVIKVSKCFGGTFILTCNFCCKICNSCFSISTCNSNNIGFYDSYSFFINVDIKYCNLRNDAPDCCCNYKSLFFASSGLQGLSTRSSLRKNP